MLLESDAVPPRRLDHGWEVFYKLLIWLNGVFFKMVVQDKWKKAKSHQIEEVIAMIQIALNQSLPP